MNTEFLNNLALGFSLSLSMSSLAYVSLGCLVGTLIGVLPGIGSVATISMLLPLTYSMDPVLAIVFLSGIYYGAQYGGSTTSILLNIPGESSSILTCLDGNALHKKGQAGKALLVAAAGSFVAGCIGTLAVVFLTKPLTSLALSLGASEYTMLLTLSLTCAVTLSSMGLLHSVGMLLAGLLLGTIGTDITSGVSRFTFGSPELLDGIGFVSVAMGLFGYGEIMNNIAGKSSATLDPQKSNIRLAISMDEVRTVYPAVLRGSLIGSALGVLPGGGAVLSSIAAYSVEKQLYRPNETTLGNGNLRGVAAPESANNAAAQTSFIPLISLGIPANAVMALLLGAFAMHGIPIGPQAIQRSPELFWTLITSMFIGNFILLILNLPLVKLWALLLKVPYGTLFPFVAVMCSIGVHASGNGSMLDYCFLSVFGLLGYLCIRLSLDGSPLLIGLLLGSPLEENLGRALTISEGSWYTFLSSPISATLVVLCVLIAAFRLCNWIKK